MIGLVCHYIVPRTRSRNTGAFEHVCMFPQRTLQLGRFRRGEYTRQRIDDTYLANVQALRDLVPVLARDGYRHFRMSASVLPLADLQRPDEWQTEELVGALALLGAEFTAAGIRYTVHPGQHCVLSSVHHCVIDRAVDDLRVIGWMFDAMGAPRSPYAAINIHAGSRDTGRRLTTSIARLPGSVRSRLTLENDESCASVVDLARVWELTGVPICFDSHHHTFNTGEMELAEAFDIACATWPDGIVPVQHSSNTDPAHAASNFMNRRKHSDLVYEIPHIQLAASQDDTIALEMEYKLKNIAIERACEQWGLRK